MHDGKIIILFPLFLFKLGTLVIGDADLACCNNANCLDRFFGSEMVYVVFLSKDSRYDGNLVLLDHFWKQLGIGYWECMVPFGPLPFATLGVVEIDVWISSLN